MKNSVVIIVASLLVSISAIACFLIWSNSNRYYLSSSGNSTYRIDRKTGEATLIAGAESKKVEEPSVIAPKKEDSFDEAGNKAIELVKKSSTFFFNMAKFFEEQSPTIEEDLNSVTRQLDGELYIYGWGAQKINDQTYLVSYKFNHENTKFGYFWEVNTEVDRITSVSEIYEKYKSYIDGYESPIIWEFMSGSKSASGGNAVNIVSPKEYDTIDNIRQDKRDYLVWNFEWSQPNFWRDEDSYIYETKLSTGAKEKIVLHNALMSGTSLKIRCKSVIGDIGMLIFEVRAFDRKSLMWTDWNSRLYFVEKPDVDSPEGEDGSPMSCFRIEEIKISIPEKDLKDAITASAVPTLVIFTNDQVIESVQQLERINRMIYRGDVERLRVLDVDFDKYPALWSHFKAKSAPSMMFVFNGKMINAVEGVIVHDQLKGWINDCMEKSRVQK